ncbi:MAG: radical SAM protein [bacterium]
MINGYLHSIETLGTLDGPGIRTVVFLQGCPLRCKFCHNIDATIPQKGQIVSVDELFTRIMSNQAYWGINGGVTFSGGEPTMQFDFLFEIISKLKQANVHVTLDTCLFAPTANILKLQPLVDLWMISLKEFDPKQHQILTGVDNNLINENIRALDTALVQNQKIRIRYVVIPGLSDGVENLTKLGEFTARIKHLEDLELLAYTNLGKEKWISTFGKYELEEVRNANRVDLESACKILEPFNLRIKF